MYYISRVQDSLRLSVVKKRLGDFKGKEGAKFHVRKGKGVDMLDLIPVYEVVNGKLKRTNELHTMWI